jgi:hypothetical protein
MRSSGFVLSTGEVYCCRLQVPMGCGGRPWLLNSPTALRMKLVLSFETSETNHLATQRDNTDGLYRQSKCKKVQSLVWKSVRSQMMH